MSFLFEAGTSLESENSINLAIESLLAEYADNLNLSQELRALCLDELNTNKAVSWDFVMNALKSFVESKGLDDDIYLSVQKRAHSNENAYKLQGPFRHSLFWPNPKRPGGFSRYGLLPIARQYQLFDKKTRIISIGSCFADEVTSRLISDGFNYLVTETKSNCKTPHNFSANWGIVFNPLAFNQAVKYYFGDLERPSICWSSSHSGELRYYDPFREDVTYSSLQEHNKDIAIHRNAGRMAFQQADLIFLTLGLTEVWQLSKSGLALARAPYRINPMIGEYRSLEVDEISSLLDEALSLIKKHNPNVKVIITVSPVPLAATFCKGSHAIESNLLSKSKLRVAVENVVSNLDFVHYFPSLEIVTYCHPKPWTSDERHISRSAVDMVFESLYLMYGPSADISKNVRYSFEHTVGLFAYKKRHKAVIFIRKIINFFNVKVFQRN